MNYSQTLSDLIAYNYRGCLIRSENKGYAALNGWYATKQEAERAVDKAYEKFGERVQEQNKPNR